MRGSGVWEIDALTAAWAVMAGVNPERGRVVFDTALRILEQETTILLGWLFLRLARQDEERQGLLDLAATRGTVLSEARAARAAAAGAAPILRQRLARSVDPASRRGAIIDDERITARPEPR